MLLNDAQSDPQSKAGAGDALSGEEWLKDAAQRFLDMPWHNRAVEEFGELAMSDLGKLLLVLGGITILVGAALLLAGRFNLPLGRLPGDIVYRGKNTVFYFPLTTCIMISVVLSLLFWLFGRGHR